MGPVLLTQRKRAKSRRPSVRLLARAVLRILDVLDPAPLAPENAKLPLMAVLDHLADPFKPYRTRLHYGMAVCHRA